MRNVAIGGGALYSNTTGYNNTALGNVALKSNTNGDENVAIGLESMYNNTSGFWNSSGGSISLYSNTTGFVNTAFGFLALGQNTTGSHNVALGYDALTANVTGSDNTCIGTYANVNSNNLSDATAIGFAAQVDASHKVRIGASSVTVIEGQVPFSTPSDGRYKYEVHEDVKGLDFILQLRPVTYQFDVSAFDAALLDKQKNLNNTIPESIRGSINRADKNQLRQAGVTEASSIRRSGFIAQEVEQADAKTGYNFSGLIKPKSENGYYSLSYESFVVPLVKAMQEQQQLIEQQNKKIAGMQREIDEIKKMLKGSR